MPSIGLMDKTSSGALITSPDFGPCYLIDDVPAVVGISRRQVDREIQRGRLTRRKVRHVTCIQVSETHRLRDLLKKRLEGASK